MVLRLVAWDFARDRHAAAALKMRYRLLDMSRGFAALAVLVWHYQHFFYDGTTNVLASAGRDQQPLYAALSRLYHYGHYGVQYFWMLSGFVFTVTYLASPLGWRAFTVRRFARLYPLHLATLLIVAAQQAAIVARTGEFFIYAHNDPYHFLLNLLFVPAWGFESDLSFNGPIWSVSVEIAIYAAFFLVLPLLRRAPFAVGLAGIGAGYLLARTETLRLFGECAANFFMGCIIFAALCRLRTLWEADRRAFGVVLALGAVGLLATLAAVARALPMQGRIYVLSAIVIAALGAIELRRPVTARAVGWLGDTSYGVYLWHVPVQLAAFLGARALGLPLPGLAATPWFLLGYMAATLAVAALGHRAIEMPAQAWVLRSWLPAREAPARWAGAAAAPPPTAPRPAAPPSPPAGGGARSA